MKISEIINEMPLGVDRSFGIEWPIGPIGNDDIDQHFIIDIDSSTALLLNDEMSPSEIKIVEWSDNGGRVIGMMELSTPPNLSVKLPVKSLTTHIIMLANSRQGIGLGTRVYTTLLDNGYTLISDRVQFAGARGLWQKLIVDSKKYGIRIYAFDHGKMITVRNRPIKLDSSQFAKLWSAQEYTLVATKSVIDAA